MSWILANVAMLKLRGQVALGKLLKDERGDVSFIAIIIVLIIVLAMAIFFRDKIFDLIKDLWALVASPDEFNKPVGGVGN